MLYMPGLLTAAEPRSPHLPGLAGVLLHYSGAQIDTVLDEADCKSPTCAV